MFDCLVRILMKTRPEAYSSAQSQIAKGAHWWTLFKPERHFKIKPFIFLNSKIEKLIDPLINSVNTMGT